MDPGSKADESVDIVGLTNSTILPLVNSLLDFDLPSVVSRVLELVTQIVSPTSTANTYTHNYMHIDHFVATTRRHCQPGQRGKDGPSVHGRNRFGRD